MRSNGSTDRAPRTAPVLVLGLGNTLLSDDGFGPFVLDELARQFGDWQGQVEFLDGGTQGLTLLGCIAGRAALVLLDALATGKAPGTVSVLQESQLDDVGARRASSAHDANAGELLAVAALLGQLPERVFLVGVEPQNLGTGLGLSESARNALPDAVSLAQAVIEEVLRNLAGTPGGQESVALSRP
ncbi:MAG TPA: hydrogenase maturation protease [Terriglobia bacterium]|nr:hydrogenase maturation protease [Terriglobia bacterium]